MTKSKVKIIGTLVIVFFLFAYPALALDPLVPCGRTGQPLCTTCDLLVLGKNISDFILFYLVPALAALFFIYAGFLILLGGGIPSRVQAGQNIFRTTAYGLMIIFLAWLIVNTTLRTVAGDQNIAEDWWKLECKETIRKEPPTTTTTSSQPGSQSLIINTSALPDGVVGQDYSQTLQASGGQTPYSWSVPVPSSPLPDGLNLNKDGTISGKPTTEGTYNFIVQAEDSSSPKLSATKALSVIITAAASPASLTITTSSLPEGKVSQNYSQTLQASGGRTPYAWSKTVGSLPAGLTLGSTGTISGSPTTAGTFNFTIKAEDSSSPKLSATKALSVIITATTTSTTTTTTILTPLACMFNGTNYSTFNLCSGQRRPGGCGNSSCSQYLASINRYAGGAASATVLKAFMVIESDCNIRAGSSSSYGLMQLRPETANMFKSACGVTDNITSSWLTDSANADKSICIGAAFIRSLAAGTCGSEPRNIYAGYNAGPGNCAVSSDCSGQQSCGGGAEKRWECPYDNPQHTVCNTGMYETKQGATYINYCLNNLGF